MNERQNQNGRADGSGWKHVAFAWGISLTACWTAAFLVLWWAYDVKTLIRGGYYARGQAITLVAQMGLIVTALTAMAWTIRRARHRIIPGLGFDWTSAWRTAAILVLYTAVIIGRLELLPRHFTDADFLPIVGHVNSYFFSDAGPLAFALFAIPVMAAISGWLCRLPVAIIAVASRSH